MKKLTALMLILCMIFSFAACSGKKEKEQPKTAVVDLEIYSQKGEMPESEYALGQNVKEMLADFEKKFKEQDDSIDIHSEEAFNYSVAEYDGYGSVKAGMIEYLYKTEEDSNNKKGSKKDSYEPDENSKVSCIINYGTAYKFEIGTLSIKLRDALTKFDSKEYSDDSNKIFFLHGAENVSCIRYSFEKNSIVFVFENNALTATAIYDNNEWSF